MCSTCGCSQKETSQLITIEQDIFRRNNRLAEENRLFFYKKNICSLNIMSSPGTGKTSLLVRTIEDLKNDTAFFVIEGDQHSQCDAARIRATGVKVEQINTGKVCHLDADMTKKALLQLSPKEHAILFIENVGNLICPTAFDLGEHVRLVMISVTEGEDKPLKYPDAFRTADVVIITKTDLLPYVDFDIALCIKNLKKINSTSTIIKLSSKTGEGMSDWYRFLRHTHKKLSKQS